MSHHATLNGKGGVCVESEKGEARIVAIAPAQGWHGHFSCAIRMHSVTPAVRVSA